MMPDIDREEGASIDLPGGGRRGKRDSGLTGHGRDDDDRPPGTRLR